MKYLALKRLDVGWDVMAGEVLEDPDNADRLVHRGFIVPVPDDYPAEVSVNPHPPEVEAPPTSDELVVAHTRESLNALALEHGVENPESHANKSTLATAIVEARDGTASVVEPPPPADPVEPVAPEATSDDQAPAETPSPTGPDQPDQVEGSTPDSPTPEA